TANLGSNQLSPVVCSPGGAWCDQVTAGVEATRPAYDGLFVPLRHLVVGDQGDQLFRLAVDDIKTGMITIPVRNLLKPVIDIAAKVLSIQINHQSSRSCTTPDGGTGIDRLSLSAVSIGILPALNIGRLGFGNASARVDACAPTARASVMEANSGSMPVAGLGYSEAWPGTSPGPNRAGPNPSVLGQQYVLVGGAKVPVEDFVEYGDLAGMLSETTATSPRDGRAVTGAVGADGSITFDDTAGSTSAPASIDLLALLEQSGLDGLTDLAVDEATLELGALGSEVQAEAGRILDPDGVGGPGRFRVGQADLTLHSPAVEKAASMVYDAIGLMDRTAESTLNKVLDLTALTKALPNGTGVTARVTSTMQDKVFAAILAKPITT
ncbi:choice-of-anchor G family protein, partial [Nocardioides albidus]